MTNPMPIIIITAVAVAGDNAWAVTCDDGAVLYVPNDPMNRHWQDVDDWINTPGNVVT